jgi:sialate O-acetylesterase
MVLQRDQAIPIWGTADAGESVQVSFSGKTATATAGEDGTWMVRLEALPANAEPAELTVKGNNERIFKDVLVGEVWVCSGQSNMEWSAGNIKQAAEEREAATFPQIRHIKVNKRPSDNLETDFNGKWTVCSPETLNNFTAVGYFFGREIHQHVGVPVGLINSSWGGTKIEPWITTAGFEHIIDQSFTKNILTQLAETDPSNEAGKKKYTQSLAKVRSWLDTAEQDVAAGRIPESMPNMPVLNRSHQDPTRLYKGMIHPLVPYGIRGAIWYQGESNGGEGETYTHKMDALITGWRTAWNQGDFPFYFVQLANFHEDRKEPQGGDGFAKIREAQRASLRIPHTGMAVITDIGDARDIHPRNKQDVGYRLAQWALKKDYGKDVVPSGPLYKSHSVEDGKIRVQFDHIGKGLIVGIKNDLDPVEEDIDGTLQRFALSGDDKNWFWADAEIDGDSVVLSSKFVDMPIAARYAYTANPEGANLYNRDGIPASPFRTDDW